MREKKKLAEESVWHPWNAAFWIHADIRCTTFEIQMEEMKAEMDQMREAAQEVPEPESPPAEPSPKILRLRGGMESAVPGSSWDIVAAWWQDMAVYTTMNVEGLDVHNAAGAEFDIMEDMISRFEHAAEAADGLANEAGMNRQQMTK